MLELAAHYLEEAGRQFRGHKRLAEGAIAQLKDEELFVTLDPEANSIAILVKHLAGNMRSRFTDFLTSDGEKPDRHRDDKFLMDNSTTRPQVMAWWEDGWRRVFDAIAQLAPEDLPRVIYIRGQEHTVLQAINRQIMHYAYHAGQIVFLAKHFRGAQWKSLSIPKGQSENLGRQAEGEHAMRRLS